MNIDSNEEKETRGEEKSIGDNILVQRRGSIQVSELNADGAERVETNGATSGLQVSGVLQVQQQQQSQGTGVCWERFLHVRSIRVLLVENDDSTRHVVTALLRNCNYEVLDAANGLQACKMLEDLTNHIDIVLTEVVMPCLSGIGLLSKIMSHKTRKNIPVIMMSSHDSMGLVFKCLSKGAVDFLVKPIRKNELKNLWQHVWRRCHSVSLHNFLYTLYDLLKLASCMSHKMCGGCSSYLHSYPIPHPTHFADSSMAITARHNDLDFHG